MAFPPVKKTGSQWEGEILSVDGMGNLVTNIPTADLLPLLKNSKLWFELGNPKKPVSVRGLVHSYADVEKGRLLAIGGSSGFVEISVRDASAAEATGLQAGDRFTLNFRT